MVQTKEDSQCYRHLPFRIQLLSLRALSVIAKIAAVRVAAPAAVVAIAATTLAAVAAGRPAWGVQPGVRKVRVGICQSNLLFTAFGVYVHVIGLGR